MKSVNHWKNVTLLKEELSKRYICNTFKNHATRKEQNMNHQKILHRILQRTKNSFFHYAEGLCPFSHLRSVTHLVTVSPKSPPWQIVVDLWTNMWIVMFWWWRCLPLKEDASSSGKHDSAALSVLLQKATSSFAP